MSKMKILALVALVALGITAEATNVSASGAKKKEEWLKVSSGDKVTIYVKTPPVVNGDQRLVELKFEYTEEGRKPYAFLKGGVLKYKREGVTINCKDRKCVSLVSGYFTAKGKELASRPGGETTEIEAGSVMDRVREWACDEE